MFEGSLRSSRPGNNKYLVHNPVRYTKEDDVIRKAVEEAVCEGEDKDGGVQADGK